MCSDPHTHRRKKEDFNNQYRRLKAPGGDWVYASVADPDLYACQSCWDNKGNEEILKNNNLPFGTFKCPGCKTDHRVKPNLQIQQSHAIGPGNPLKR